MSNWVSAHCDTLIERRLAYMRKRLQRTYFFIQIIPIKEEWMRGWSNEETGRELFRHMPVPKRADNVNTLNRKDQSTIFRMRTQHIALNKHLHRIGAHTTPACPLCDNPNETIDHHLLHCAPLSDLRNQFLSLQLKKESLLYGNP